jgi:ribonuclease HI
LIIEVFTDGSSFIDGDYKVSSSSYAIYIKDKLITSSGKFHDPGTNNFGESMAVLLGLVKTNKLLQKVAKSDKKVFNKPINIIIYTDSYITCESCRTWIYDWLKKNHNGVLLNSTGKKVANQEVFKIIHKDFLTNNLFKIKFYHINSHIIDNKFYNKYIDKFKEYFSKRHYETIDLDIPDQLFTSKKFKDARKTYKAKNNESISNIELLRLLVYNKYVDNLAEEYVQAGLAAAGRETKDEQKAKVKEKIKEAK